MANTCFEVGQIIEGAYNGRPFKFRALKEAYEKEPALVDEVLMAICGWRMETLVDNAIAVCDE